MTYLWMKLNPIDFQFFIVNASNNVTIWKCTHFQAVTQFVDAVAVCQKDLLVLL